MDSFEEIIVSLIHDITSNENNADFCTTLGEMLDLEIDADFPEKLVKRIFKIIDEREGIEIRKTLVEDLPNVITDSDEAKYYLFEFLKKDTNKDVRMLASKGIYDIYYYNEYDKDFYFEYCTEVIPVLVLILNEETSIKIRKNILKNIKSFLYYYLDDYEELSYKIDSLSNDQAKELFIFLDDKSDKIYQLACKLKSSKRYDTRLKALFELDDIGKSNNIIKLVFDAFNDVHENVRDSAAGWIGHIQTKFIIKKLFEKLLDESETLESRITSIWAMEYMLHRKELVLDRLNILNDILTDNNIDSEIRMWVAWLLIEWKIESWTVIESFYNILNDESNDYDLIEECKRGLRSIARRRKISYKEFLAYLSEEKSSIDDLVNELKPRNSFKRSLAARALEELGERAISAVETLKESILHDSDIEVRKDSLSALIEINEDEVYNIILELIYNKTEREYVDEDRYIIDTILALSFISFLEFSKAFPILLRLIKHEENDLIRYFTIIELAKINNSSFSILSLLNSEKSARNRLKIIELQEEKLTPEIENELVKHLSKEKSGFIRRKILEILSKSNNEKVLKKICNLKEQNSLRVNNSIGNAINEISKRVYPSKSNEISNNVLKLDEYPTKELILDKLKILFISANPAESDSLRQGKEYKVIRDRLNATNYRDKFEILQEWAFDTGDFTGLLKLDPHLIHITCHGTDTGELVFEDEFGDVVKYSAVDFAKQFEYAKAENDLSNLVCVIISACYSELIAEELTKYLDCVIAMSSEIDEYSATKFSGQLYYELINGRKIDRAFHNACRQLQTENQDNIPDIYVKPNSAIPRLILKGENIKKTSIRTELEIPDIYPSPYNKVVNEISKNREPDLDLIIELIGKGENSFVEFKETLRWNKKKGGKDERLEFAALKTLCGLMNTKGGFFFIGVNDDCQSTGIEVDFQTLNKQHQDRDGYSVKLTNLIESHLISNIIPRKLIHEIYMEIEGKDVCIIKVDRSTEPVYLEFDKKTHFFVRVSNSTIEFTGPKADRYKQDHWNGGK